MSAGGIDNVVAYMEGQGAVETEREPDLIAFMGGYNYSFPLVVRGDIESWSDLKGQKLAVDAATTGYAFLMRKMLEDNGLAPGDYEFVSVGGPNERTEAMKTGEFAGALVNMAQARQLEAFNCRPLVSDPDPWANYQGNVFTARRDWAAAHKPEMLGFVRAFQKGVDHTLDSSHNDELAEMLLRYLPKMPPQAAPRAVAALQSGPAPLVPGTPISIEGIRTVLALRSAYGEPRKEMSDPYKYLNMAYYEEATGRSGLVGE
jgi:ABC-type nitrate/sulfonate/bicarbonate transport system substrate-binding protein